MGPSDVGSTAPATCSGALPEGSIEWMAKPVGGGKAALSMEVSTLAVYDGVSAFVCVSVGDVRVQAPEGTQPPFLLTSAGFIYRYGRYLTEGRCLKLKLDVS